MLYYDRSIAQFDGTHVERVKTMRIAKVYLDEQPMKYQDKNT